MSGKPIIAAATLFSFLVGISGCSTQRPVLSSNEHLIRIARQDIDYCVERAKATWTESGADGNQNAFAGAATSSVVGAAAGGSGWCGLRAGSSRRRSRCSAGVVSPGAALQGFFFRPRPPWLDQEVNSTILDLYRFELARNSRSNMANWRRYCSILQLYHYNIGLTENDAFHSNQVREGPLTRAKALELVRTENRPRLSRSSGANLKIPSSAYIQFHFLDQPRIMLDGQHLLLLLLDLALFCNKRRSDLAENLIRPLLSVYA